MKPKPKVGREERPITAQPIGERFGVDTRGLEHYSKEQDGVVSDNERTMAPGCFRRLPTSRD